ncbi:hypothetical protein Peur_055763 [Populus x canadensis]
MSLANNCSSSSGAMTPFTFSGPLFTERNSFPPKRRSSQFGKRHSTTNLIFPSDSLSECLKLVMPVGGLACARHGQLLFWAPPSTKRLDNIVFDNSNSKNDGFSKETAD